MTFVAFLLTTLSAVAHALWNFFGQRQNPSAVLFLTASLTAIVLFSPALLLLGPVWMVISSEVWVLLIATGLTQALYYRALAGAYRRGDLSVVYPLARALPVVLIALVGLALGRADRIGGLALPGFVLVTLGCLILPLRRFSDLRLWVYRQPGVRSALLAAVGVAGYMLLDDQALRLLRSLPGAPLSALEWALLWVEMETITLTLFLLLSVLLRPSERQELRHMTGADWRFALALGFVITATYALVLGAMAYARDVSYVSAFRQLSIPIGATLGIFVRGESAPPPKLVGVGCILLGLILAAVP